jgi:S-adenosylmethionine hydrolase
MTVVSLLTDFGLKDGNVGVMKGVILGLAPQARLVDLGHLVGAQDIREAAIVLERSAPYFPAGSIHVVVVDPGVGTSRRPMAARLGEHFFVGPDNGVVTAARARRASPRVDVFRRTELLEPAVRTSARFPRWISPPRGSPGQWGGAESLNTFVDPVRLTFHGRRHP